MGGARVRGGGQDEPVREGRELGDDPGGVLVAQDPEHERDPASGEELAEGARERAGAGRVVRAVQHEDAVGSPEDLEAPRPARALETLAHRRLGDVELACRRHGEQRVRRLERAEQAQAHVRQRPAGARARDHLAVEIAARDRDAEVAPREKKRDADGGGAADEDFGRLGRLGRGERDAAPDDRRLLRRDRGERRPEDLLVVEVQARDHRHRGHADGRRVEPAAEPHLEHRDVHRLTREVVERERGRRLEHRRVEARDERAERLDAVHDTVLGDRLGVHADALAERDEVRRRVEANAVTGRLEDRGEQRRHRALAVRAADLDEPVAPLGMAQRGEQCLDALEPGTHACVLTAAQGGEPGDRVGVRHRRVSPAGTAGPRRRPGSDAASP